MLRRTRIGPLFAAISLALSACGGGGTHETTSTPTPNSLPTSETEPASRLERYVGTWIGLCDINIRPGVSATYPDGVSEIEVVTIAETGHESGRFEGIEYKYLNSTCTGTPSSQDTYQRAFSLVGSIPVGNDTADQVLSIEGQETRRGMILVKDGRLYNARGGAIGPDGYPTAIDFSFYFTRQ